MELVLQDGRGRSGKRYCRSNSNQSLHLANLLVNCHPCKSNRIKAIITPSGMSAISIVLNCILMKNTQNKINIIKENESYPDTHRTISYLHNTFNFEEYIFDINNQSIVLSIFDNIVSDQINILYIESASNPSGNIFDFTIIPKLRKKSKKLYVVVDNTWLTHVIFNPFKYDIDIAVMSLTKYYSGGKCIAGAIVCKKNFYGWLFDYARINGLHVSPIHCQIIIDAMNDMETRIIKASKTTTVLAELLSDNSNFIVVRHASLLKDSSHPFAVKFYNKYNNDIIYPSVISFIVRLKSDEAIEWMKSKNINYETSYGSAESRFRPIYKSYIDPTNEINQVTLCRLSIGFDDIPERLYEQVTCFPKKDEVPS